MTTLNATSARKNFFKLMEDAVTTHEPIYYRQERQCGCFIGRRFSLDSGNTLSNLNSWNAGKNYEWIKGTAE